MAIGFGNIPDVVIDYVREIFSGANNRVSRTLTDNPSFHEPMLDGLLIADLSAAPPVFFAEEQVALQIETHFLGSRRMFQHWEIADLAIFVILRRAGHLDQRKVALLQTKRLYSKQVHLTEIELEDYMLGIGRLADATDPLRPLYHQRAFEFDKTSVYGATWAGHKQIDRIEQYVGVRDIPVYYGLYNPLTLPHRGFVPGAPHINDRIANEFGFRVLPAKNVHAVMEKAHAGQPPSVADLTFPERFDPEDGLSNCGWRLERFVADEVLKCRQGRIFHDNDDQNLRGLLYERSAPITGAIVVTIDFSPDAELRGAG